MGGNAADLFVRALENEGVTSIFGIPGEENLDLLEALRRSSIRLILTRHEQAAGFMAATIGRLTGKAGVCISTLGPGATNLVTAAAYAQLGAMPLLMVTGQKPIKRSKQGRFQIIDTVDMMKPLTKFTKQIVNGETVPSLVRESFRMAEEEPPGAVHLELPEDIAREKIKDATPFTAHKIRRPTAEKKAIQRAAALIENANQPLILIGAGANRKRTQQALVDFMKKTRIPFCNTQMGKGVVDERHPLFLGTAALSEGDFLHCALSKADLIINIGHDIVEKPPFLMNHSLAPTKRVIHINFFSASVDEVYYPDLEVIGDIAQTVKSLTHEVEVQKHWDFSFYTRIKTELEAEIDAHSGPDAFPVIPHQLVRTVREVMPSDGILTLDNGIYKIWFARNYKAHLPNTLLLDNALATMGAGLPSAIAAKLAFPNKKVISICGDGGFMMNSQEIETAVRLKLDLTVGILNDNAYGMIKWKQSELGLPNFGLDFENPDFVAQASSYGATGHRVEKGGQLVQILNKCLSSPGVHILDIPIDYSKNAQIINCDLRDRVCRLEEQENVQ